MNITRSAFHDFTVYLWLQADRASSVPALGSVFAIQFLSVWALQATFWAIDAIAAD